MKKRISGILILALALFSVYSIGHWLVENNKNIETVFYNFTSDRIPASFDGFRIVHVSDLHNEEMGPANADLLQKIQDADPDIIAVTGDLIDCRVPDAAISLAFMEKALQIAPVYYVTGNHEGALFDIYPSFEEELLQMGVVVLHNEAVTIARGDDSITILGVDDPNMDRTMEENLVSFLSGQNKNSYTVLLSHRPELFESYCEGNADLVLTGHAHGGQVRVPGIGGLYAPGQGLLPQYDAGLFSQDETNMIVSRGIGNSLFPMRVNNRPELPVAILYSE